MKREIVGQPQLSDFVSFTVPNFIKIGSVVQKLSLRSEILSEAKGEHPHAFGVSFMGHFRKF